MHPAIPEVPSGPTTPLEHPLPPEYPAPNSTPNLHSQSNSPTYHPASLSPEMVRRANSMTFRERPSPALWRGPDYSSPLHPRLRAQPSKFMPGERNGDRLGGVIGNVGHLVDRPASRGGAARNF